MQNVSNNTQNISSILCIIIEYMIHSINTFDMGFLDVLQV